MWQILRGVRGRTLYGKNENVFAFPAIMLPFLPNIVLQLFEILPTLLRMSRNCSYPIAHVQKLFLQLLEERILILPRVVRVVLRGQILEELAASGVGVQTGWRRYAATILRHGLLMGGGGCCAACARLLRISAVLR